MRSDKYRWYKEHPNLYEAELNALKNGLNGKFKIIKLYEPEEYSRLIVLGILCDEVGKEHQLRIVFPSKYPNSPPNINLGTFNKGSDSEDFLFQPILLGKGNQYNDGSLCLLRRDLWDEKSHNIGWLLKRAQKWLTKAYSQDGFQKEDIVEEIPLYGLHQGQVIFPSEFIPNENLNEGQFILSQFKPGYYILQTNILPSAVFSIKINDELFVWKKVIGITAKNLFENNFSYLLQMAPPTLGHNIAFYLPDDPVHWHFFKYQISGMTVNVKYLLGKTIEKELYLRTKDIFDNDILKRKKVTIIGLGALGSEVAKSLARNGVGHFNLFDYDTFELGNSVRHAADLFYIGELKTNVVKQLILRSNPNITVNTYPIDILDDDVALEQCLENSDICICLTAEEHVDYILNDYYSIKYKIPFVFSRVSPGGNSGSIQIVQNGISACLRCLSKNNLDFLPLPKHKKDFEELPVEMGCGVPALPGSEIDTKEICIQVSRISLQLLLRNASPNYPEIIGNQFYWHGPSGSETGEPFQWEIKNIGQDKNCGYCNK